MSMLLGTKRALFGGKGIVPPYLLRAPFTADDQGFANAQVLDTEAEGILQGQLTVVETDGAIAILTNRLILSGKTVSSWTSLGLYSANAITRALGRALLLKFESANTGNMTGAGWHDTAEINAASVMDYGFYTNADDLSVDSDDAPPVQVTTGNALADNTEYELALVLGGYTSAQSPYYAAGAGTYTYGCALFIKGGGFSTWTLLWRWRTQATASLYPTLSSRHTMTVYYDNVRVPTTDLSAVLEPNNLSLFASAGELNAYTPEVGGGWTEDIGDWDTAAGVLQATALGIATFTGLADCVYDAKITTPGAGTTAGGLVVRGADYTGGSEDYWYVKVTPGTVGTDWELIEYAAGAATQRASGDVDWAVATAYNIRAICDGQDIACFADGGDKIGYVSAASGETATDFGLRDEGNANMTFDNDVLFARMSSVYGATLDAV